MTKMESVSWKGLLNQLHSERLAEPNTRGFWGILDQCWSRLRTAPRDRDAARELRSLFTAMLALMCLWGRNVSLVLESYGLVADSVGEALGYSSPCQKSLTFIPPSEKKHVLAAARALAGALESQRPAVAVPSADDEQSVQGAYSVFGLPSSHDLSLEKPYVEYEFLVASAAP